MKTDVIRAFQKNTLRLIPAAVALMVIGNSLSAQTGAALSKGDFGFVNVADNTTNRFQFFGAMPAINAVGAVAFTASGTGFPMGAAFKWDHNTVTTIASSGEGSMLGFVGASVDINPAGT